MTVLVVAEKPSAAKNFAKALGGMEGSFEGTDYEICALRGHVMTLAEPAAQVPQALSEQYKKWSLTTMPWKYSDLSFSKVKRGDVDSILRLLSKKSRSCSEICIATDDDPSGEGEMLAWEALDEVGFEGQVPVTRMWFADEGERSVQKAFRERAPVERSSDGDLAKAECRERWDFMSMQFTRIATCVARKAGYRDTVVREGRLKSVIVWLVGSQLDAIRHYVKKPFYEPRFRDANGNVYKLEDSEDERKEKKGDVDLSRFHASGVVEDSRKEKKRAPGKLLDLAGLSAILAEKGYTPAGILKTYQKMYEDHIVSYPRTEDKTVTPGQFDDLLPLTDRIARVVGVDPSVLTHRVPRKTHVKEGGAHGANRPGEKVPLSLSALSDYGKEGPAIYETLARNWLAMLAEDYVYEQVKGHVSDFPDYVATTNLPVSAGFKAVFDSDEASKDKEAPDGNEEGALGLKGPAEPFVHEGANKKPQKPTMKWLKTRLEKHDVGTGATRTSTIADVCAGGDTALLSNKKGVLSLTRCGEVSYALLDGCEIASPEATERLFGDMRRVGEFELSGESVVSGIDEMVEHDMAQMQANMGKLADLVGPAREIVGKCPVCGAPVLLKKSKSGVKWLDCSSNRMSKQEDGTWVQKAGCGFKMGTKFFGKQLTAKQLAAVLSGKRAKVSGLKSKKGSTWAGYARLSTGPDERGWWSTELDGFADDRKKGKKGGGAHGRKR